MLLYTFGIILVIRIQIGVLPQSSSECEDIKCSMVYDPVCVYSRSQWSGTEVINTFHNKCVFNKVKCEMRDSAKLLQVADDLCDFGSPAAQTRRRVDFTIIGAHQMCNHSCPLYCVDTYDPVCALILKSGSGRKKYMPMVNHCHVDMFSCTTGANVSIYPLSKCYKNAAGFNFMAQVAALKFMDLLEEPKNAPLRTAGNRPATFIG